VQVGASVACQRRSWAYRSTDPERANSADARRRSPVLERLCGPAGVRAGPVLRCILQPAFSDTPSDDSYAARRVVDVNAEIDSPAQLSDNCGSSVPDMTTSTPT
jgi:hypothetical protein